MDKGIIAANINAPFRFQSTAFSSRKILTKLEDEKFDCGLKKPWNIKMQSVTIPWNCDFKHPGQFQRVAVPKGKVLVSLN